MEMEDETNTATSSDSKENLNEDENEIAIEDDDPGDLDFDVISDEEEEEEDEDDELDNLPALEESDLFDLDVEDSLASTDFFSVNPLTISLSDKIPTTMSFSIITIAPIFSFTKVFAISPISVFGEEVNTLFPFLFNISLTNIFLLFYDSFLKDGLIQVS